MRIDNVGFFWQDAAIDRSRGERVLGPMPPIPETGWVAPRDFPNLSGAKIIGLDTETYDPQLTTNGPGWGRRAHSGVERPEGLPPYLHTMGSMVGVSVATHDRAWYFPLRHTIQPETNCNPENVFAWLRDTLAGNQPKVGTNLIYDVGWLQEEGVQVNGPLLDIGYAEALLSETARLSLDAMSKKYLSTGKVTNLLYQWCSDWYGGSDKDQRKNIWRSPPSLVGHYAEADALYPLRIFEQQKKLLEGQDLLHVFDMECRLIRLLIAMRLRGVRVDIDKAVQVDELLTARIDVAQETLNKIADAEVNVNAAATIAPIFDRIGIKYPMTEKTERPSFTGDFLENIEHPVVDHIKELRHCMKLRDTFVRSYILDSHVNGRLHGQFHPMRNEGYGARSGRLSSSNPNLQNIPVRSDLGRAIRTLFVPEYGQTWMRYDYSQIEYRFLLHFAVGGGAEEARQLYYSDPSTDYHAIVQEMLRVQVDRVLERKPTKNINFGLIYGMGEPTLSRKLNLPHSEAKQLFRDYHKAVPYARATMDHVSNLAQQQGYIQTILGRRSRFELWEPTKYNDESIPTTFEKAVTAYGTQIKRSQLHKSLNRLLQGSAADMIKAAMLTCYEDGLFEGEFLPLLTVHDELDFSAQDPRAPIWGQIREVMETVIPLTVPVIAAPEIGPDWGHLKEIGNG